MSLSINNLCIGNVISRINNCISTNIYAKKLLSKNEPIEGTVIITDKQSKGKGQIGNLWQSEYYKNLTFSIILKPKFLLIEQQFLLSKIISLACVDVLNEYKKDSFYIKWPNDIYYKNKKIGGILIENIISANHIKNSVVGIGLNINQNIFEGLNDAISLKNIMLRDFKLENVLQKILVVIDKYYFDLRTSKINKINIKYLQKMLGLNQEREFILTETNNKFIATVKGVNEVGQLHLKVETKDVFYNFKEIRWIW